MGINHTSTETKRTRRALALAFGLAMIFVLSLGLQAANPAHAATTFTVNSTDDGQDANHGDGICATVSDECTLRAAIEEANATKGADTINFAIPGVGPHTISPGSKLPTITQRVTIDGYTQGDATSDTADDATENTLTQPDKTDAVLKIKLDGTSAGSANGLEFNSGASNSVIRGLVITHFSPYGIYLRGGTGYKVEGNFIGTDPLGTAAEGNNNTGVFMENTSNSTIGGTDADDGTVDGVVEVRNLISGNGSDGVGLLFSSGNKVQGNLIGPDKDGGTLGNGRIGTGAGTGSTGNSILSNSIFSNGGPGIDLITSITGVTANDGDDPSTTKPDPDKDTGPNRLQNYPLITSAQTFGGFTSINGTLESNPSTKKKKTFIIQFFSSPQADSSGFGEGQTFLGQTEVTTDKEGNASVSFAPNNQVVPADGHTVVTATATDKKTGDTSEFSNAKVVKEPDIGGGP